MYLNFCPRPLLLTPFAMRSVSNHTLQTPFPSLERRNQTDTKSARSLAVSPSVIRLPDSRLTYKSVIRFSGDSKVPGTTCQLDATLWLLVIYGNSDFAFVRDRCSKHGLFIQVSVQVFWLLYIFFIYLGGKLGLPFHTRVHVYTR